MEGMTIRKGHIILMLVITILSIGFSAGALSVRFKLENKITMNEKNIRANEFSINKVEGRIENIEKQNIILNEIKLNLKNLCNKFNVKYIETK